MTVETEGNVQAAQVAQEAQETNDAFSAGFGEVRGSETTAAPAPAKTEETQAPASAAPATDAAPAKPEVDEWEGVAPQVKAKLESLQETLASVVKVPDRLRNIEGQIGGLASVTKELKAALDKAGTAASAKGAETPTQAQVTAAMRNPEAWKRLKEDFPDWADAIEPELADIRAQLDKLAKGSAPDTSALKTEITGDVDTRIKAASKDAVGSARTLAYLDLKHGRDWEKRIATPEFEAWYAKQPKETKDLSASTDADAASKLIGLYDAHLKKSAEETERKKRLDRAVAPQGTATAPAAGEDPEAAFAAGYENVRSGAG